jgi:8-oxo-dGTP pyrophosphatase MutT (NUDIX family)
MNEDGYEKRPRAGLIPYLRDETGSLCYLMMVCSDPKFGGHRPMISKGKIEEGETPLQCAVREAEEELGFKAYNVRGDIHQVFAGRVELFSGAYDLTVFTQEVADRYDFGKWCDETQYTVWMGLDDFRKEGRRDHIKFVEAVERMVQR